MNHSVDFTFDIITARSIYRTATTAVATVFEVFLHFAFCLTDITFFLTAFSSCFSTSLALFLTTSRDGLQLIKGELEAEVFPPDAHTIAANNDPGDDPSHPHL